MTQTPDDPALRAARGVEQAEAALLSLPVIDAFDELQPAFVQAEAEWERADLAFADAVPTTPEGVLVKLRALEGLLRAVPLEENSLEIRHLRALVIYLERSSAGVADRPRARSAAVAVNVGRGP